MRKINASVHVVVSQLRALGWEATGRYAKVGYGWNFKMKPVFRPRRDM